MWDRPEDRRQTEKAGNSQGSEDGADRPRSAFLSVEEETIVATFRHRRLPPLDDCLYTQVIASRQPFRGRKIGQGRIPVIHAQPPFAADRASVSCKPLGATGRIAIRRVNRALNHGLPRRGDVTDVGQRAVRAGPRRSEHAGIFSSPGMIPGDIPACSSASFIQSRPEDWRCNGFPQESCCPDW